MTVIFNFNINYLLATLVTKKPIIIMYLKAFII